MSIIKSKSTPILAKEQHDELSSLKEIEMASNTNQIIETVQQQETSFNLKCVQIATFYACIGSVFFNDVPNIMTKIINAFKNGFSLSPDLIQRPSSQAFVTSFMTLIPCSILFCYLLNRCKILNEVSLYKPLKFLVKIMSLLLIPYSLHYGDCFGVYVFGSSAETRILLFVSIISFAIYVFSFYSLSRLKALNFNNKTAFYLIVQQIPTFIKFLSMFFNKFFENSAKTAMLTFNFVCILLFASLMLIVNGRKPFDEVSWNKRSIATLCGGLIFNFMHMMDFFFPDLSSYTITFCFIAVIAVVYFEHGKIPPLAYSKRIRRASARPAYSESLDDLTAVSVGKRPVVHVMKQDVVALSWFFGMIMVMTLFNAYASVNMPLGQPLPDMMHKFFPDIGEEIRAAPVFKKMQFSNFICTVGMVSFFIMHLFSMDTTNGRKIFTIYGTLCVIRMFGFALTLFPAPCTGLSNCPCANPDEIEKLSHENPVWVATAWTFALGMYSSYPQCGDLVVSGHTMFMWLTFKWHYEVARRLVKRTSANTIFVLLITLFVFAAAYITLSRNHYTVDVWFGFVFSELLFDIYTYYEKRMFTSDNTLMVRFIRWLETRKYPLIYTDYEGDDEPGPSLYDA